MTEILKVPAAVLRPLRDKVLRENLPPGSVYAGDDSGDSCHLAAYLGGEIVAVGTIYREQLSDRPELDAWRIRGMATLPEYQGQGIGRQIANLLVEHAVAQHAHVLWCQARTSKRRFYHALGFVDLGQEYGHSEYSNVRFVKMIQYFPISRKL